MSAPQVSCTVTTVDVLGKQMFSVELNHPDVRKTTLVCASLEDVFDVQIRAFHVGAKRPTTPTPKSPPEGWAEWVRRKLSAIGPTTVKVLTAQAKKEGYGPRGSAISSSLTSMKIKGMVRAEKSDGKYSTWSFIKPSKRS